MPYLILNIWVFFRLIHLIIYFVQNNLSILPLQFHVVPAKPGFRPVPVEGTPFSVAILLCVSEYNPNNDIKSFLFPLAGSNCSFLPVIRFAFELHINVILPANLPHLSKSRLLVVSIGDSLCLNNCRYFREVHRHPFLAPMPYQQ